MALKDLFAAKFRTPWASFFEAARNKEEIAGELEELLVLADISLPLAERIMAGIRSRMKGGVDRDETVGLLRRELLAVFANQRRSSLETGDKSVLLLVGVNGSGKTTTAAKLARHYQDRGRRVLLAAADTFRAAGSTQLELWGGKLGIPVVSGERGADPGSVVFNAVRSWQEKDFDLLIVDTAGRMQSKENLMRELEKITKVIKKISPAQPAETWLVLDASTGQNALAQAEKFREFSAINGLVLAKLDGTAKGGSVITIADRMRLPVLFVGHGEAEGDLGEFSPGEFVDSLLGA
jgi:fused signal recognition particle receptor